MSGADAYLRKLQMMDPSITGAIEDQDPAQIDYSAIPFEEKLVSSNWMIKKSALEHISQNASNLGWERINMDLKDFILKAMQASLPGLQSAAIECLLALAESDAKNASSKLEILSGDLFSKILVDDLLSTNKPQIKKYNDKLVQHFILNVGFDNLQAKLNPFMNSKNPKTQASCLELITKTLQIFGIQKFNPMPYN